MYILFLRRLSFFFFFFFFFLMISNGYLLVIYYKGGKKRCKILKFFLKKNACAYILFIFWNALQVLIMLCKSTSKYTSFLKVFTYSKHTIASVMVHEI